MQNEDKVRVIFVCTGNACRSQMAEGWARYYFGDSIEAFSAGVAPGGIDRRAIQVMAEEGVDISHAKSKDVSDFGGQSFDLAVTVCDHAREVCPVVPGAAMHYHRGFDDPPMFASGLPEERVLKEYRRIRDEIRNFVRGLPELIEDLLSRNGE